MNDSEIITLTFGIISKYDISGKLLSSKKVGSDILRRLYGHPKIYVDRIALEVLSLDNESVALALVNGNIQIWNADEEFIYEYESINSLQALEKWRPILAFSPDGKYLVFATRNGGLKLLNLSNYTFKELLNLAEVTTVRFSPDSKTILVGNSDKTLKLWNLQEERISSYSGINSIINGLDISKDGKLIAATTVDGKVHVWKIEGKKVLTSQEVECN